MNDEEPIPTYSNRFPDYHDRPLKLTVDEINDPHLVLKEFFAGYHLREIRIYINSLLRDALRADDADALGHVNTCQDLEKLAEAAWVLYHTDRENARLKVKGNPSLQGLLDLITISLQPEAVFLLDEACPDLLIVLPDALQTPFAAWQDIVQALAAGVGVFTFSLHRQAELARQIKEGYPFYVFACTAQALIYQREGFTLPVPAPALTAALQQKAGQHFRTGIDRAKSFLSGARMYMQAEDWVLAAFMLHQSLETTCRTMIQAFYDHDPRTHSIAELKKQCRRICPAIHAQLPGGSLDEERLLGLLEQVYVQGRYGKAFEVSGRDTVVLFDRVEQIIQIAQASFESKISNYKTV